MAVEKEVARCQYCFNWIPVESFVDHCVEVHGISEEEAKKMLETAERRTKVYGRKLQEELEEELEKLEEESEFLTVKVPKSSEILRELLERYRIKDETAETIIAEVEDLEEGRDHEQGHFVTPQEVAYILQIAGIKQPKLQYIVNKYAQKVWKYQTEIAQRLSLTGFTPMYMQNRPGATPPATIPVMPPTPLMNPFMPMNPMMLPYQYPYPQDPYYYRREREGRIPYKLEDGSEVLLSPKEIVLMKMLKQMEEEAEIRRQKWEMERQEFELRLQKLKKELEESSGGSFRQELDKIREELHKKDLEILKKEFELQTEKLKQPDFFTMLQYIQTAAQALGYQKGGQTGLQVLDSALQRIDQKADKLLDLLSKASLLRAQPQFTGSEPKRTPKERENLINMLEQKINRLEQKKQLESELKDLAGG